MGKADQGGNSAQLAGHGWGLTHVPSEHATVRSTCHEHAIQIDAGGLTDLGNHFKDEGCVIGLALGPGAAVLGNAVAHRPAGLVGVVRFRPRADWLPITTDPGGRALERPGVVALVPAARAHAPRGDKNKSKTIRFGRHNRFVQKGILILTPAVEDQCQRCRLGGIKPRGDLHPPCAGQTADIRLIDAAYRGCSPAAFAGRLGLRHSRRYE